MADKVTVTLPDGSQIERQEPMIPARTSTKVGIAGIAGVLPIIQGIQEIEFPWPWLEQLTNSDVFVQVATIAAMYFVARFTKSPIAKQAL